MNTIELNRQIRRALMPRVNLDNITFSQTGFVMQVGNMVYSPIAYALSAELGRSANAWANYICRELFKSKILAHPSDGFVIFD